VINLNSAGWPFSFTEAKNGHQQQTRLAPHNSKARRSPSCAGYGLSGRLCIRLAESQSPSPTGTARLANQPRLSPAPSRSHPERRLGTSQDAARTQRLRTAFRLSVWRFSESDLRTCRISIFLWRPVRGSLSELNRQALPLRMPTC
jgi:hypothetical protein